MVTDMADSKLGALGWERCGELVADYVAPSKKFGWPLYDEDLMPARLVGVDLTAPGLLSYPIKSTYLDCMGCESLSDVGKPNPYRSFYLAMKRFVEGGGDVEFVDLPTEAVRSLEWATTKAEVIGPPEWKRLGACLIEVQLCDGLTSVAATKILHRKRPSLVPINDSLVREFFGVKRGYPALFLALHDELSDGEVRVELERIALRYKGIDGRCMSVLRALDIIVWMEMRSRKG